MGRPRKTADTVSSPRPASTPPKAAPAAPPSSASLKLTKGSYRASSTPAATSEGSRRGGKAASSGTGQSYQPRSTAASGSSQGVVKSSPGARAKTPTASGGKSHATTAGVPADDSARPSKVTTGRGSKTSSSSPPLNVGEIEIQTRGQRTNPEWHKWRENRITASVAPKIAKSKFVNGQSSEVPQSYLKAVVESGSGVMTSAMSWGIRNEKKAVQAYEALKSSKAKKPITVDDCGLFVDKGKSWLAASPDGIVKEAQTGKKLAVLEVKCPYKYRNKTVTDACKDKTFCLEKEGESYTLKENHPYYTQVQCQMGITGLKKADFVVHTNKETAIAPVDFDPAFWDSTVPKLEKFYNDAVVPYLEQKQDIATWAKEE